jgi:hypothetical protein
VRSHKVIEPTKIGDALKLYEVRIEGYFDDVVPADDETSAIEVFKATLPGAFTVDETTAWEVSGRTRGKHVGP